MNRLINFSIKYKFCRCLVNIVAVGLLLSCRIAAQAVPGERVTRIENPQNKMVISINAPIAFPAKHTLLIFYALPNGNTIEWTMGKKMAPGDDWHYDIQHIDAQLRWLRTVMTGYNLVLVYMANQLKAWPAWKRERTNGPAEIKRVVDSIAGSFAGLEPEIMLNSHSGGGSFIFGYLDASEQIPAQVTRIGFIDSDYGYEDSLHGAKLVNWLRGKKHFLYVLAYNDSVVIYNGKPLVSPTGGTWWRSQRMQQRLSENFHFTRQADTAFIRFHALRNRAVFLLKTNPEGNIYHTEQVARNGFIHTVIGGTEYEKKGLYTYWGERVYAEFMR